MPAINFSAQFASMVKHGLKRTTIRKERRGQPILEGHELALYTGMRTKKCILLGRKRCLFTKSIEIGEDHVEIEGRSLKNGPTQWLARIEGFTSWAAFREFFRDRYGLPFKGRLIAW